MKPIDKDALVAEIERKKKYAQTLGNNAINGSMQQFYDGMKQGCVDILSFLDTLEVKEVDLEKEIKRFTMSKELYEADSAIKAVAKHFFELGLSVNNPTTVADRGIINGIIATLNAFGEENMISYDKEIEWLRNKAQKGE